MGMGPPPGPGGPALSPGGGPMALSPTTVPPVSPGNRRFMAAMNDLIAGPSDDQRRQKDLARQRLQADLEAQIREKKERQVGPGSVGRQVSRPLNVRVPLAVRLQDVGSQGGTFVVGWLTVCCCKCMAEK